ncbi:MAG TPA: adenylate/guanylate cyclase domain-containing protein [Actinomycetota bacterium]|nr:adenylate/guanylate cyclase domain-containing protein [Actinomycetota bacterium]
MNRHRRIALLSSAAIAIVVTALSWAGLSAGAFQSLQPRLVDGLFPAVEPDPRIVVVMIDDTSIAAIGQWPWDRSVHAEMIRNLERGRAARIGYDVTFTEASNPGSDAQLAAAVKDAKNVVLAAGVEYKGRPEDVPVASKYYPPVSDLPKGALAVGHVSVFPDQDGVVRTLAPVIRRPDGRLLPSLALSLALAQPDEADISLARQGVRTIDGVVPTGEAHLMDVNYTDNFKTYSAIDVLRDDVPKDAFQNATVLVGASALGLGDYRLTPLDKRTGQPGVLVHANALNTILTGAYLKPDSTQTTLVWVFLVALLIAIGISFPRLLFAPVAPIIVTVGFVLLAFQRFDAGAVTNFAYPVLAIGLSTVSSIGARYFTELRERRRVTRVFGRYLSKDVVDEVLAAPSDAVASLDGASPVISVLFADLRGFTSASENLPPRTVVGALNIFLEAMTRGVLEEQGTIDKFMGDCVMAFWNSPRPEPKHAERAVCAALRMQQYIDEAMREGTVSDLAVKGCGVGIATGEAVVGNIGSSLRLDYTVIGDTVNTASRLCGVAEARDVVITETCAQHVADVFELEALAPLTVKGKEEPLRVFRVCGLQREEHPPQPEELPDPEETVDAPTKAASYAPIEPLAEETS